MNKKRAAAYARVSTNSRAQEHSFEFQSRYWNQTLGNNDDYDYIGLFADKGISGKYVNRRPQFLAEERWISFLLNPFKGLHEMPRNF